MRAITFLLLLGMILSIQAQNPVLYIGNGSDCIHSDANAANGARTFELWFKPYINYDTNLIEFASLICRDVGAGQPNVHEFYIAFQPQPIYPAGALRFSYYVSPNDYYAVLSDTNHWDAGVWYHVAGVIHPDSGMMLFINGKKQAGTAAYYDATAITDLSIGIGSWGYPPSSLTRFFNGSIDDIRISASARYDDDFIPPCPNLITDGSTIALWNIDEGSGNILIDSSGNGHYAFLDGGFWYNDNPCTPTAVNDHIDLSFAKNVVVYPNPAKDNITVDLGEIADCDIRLMNNLGMLLIGRSYKNLVTPRLSIDISELPAGTYLLRIKSDRGSTSRKIVIAN
ncbi:MAG: LamG-like jellyroll fold domain-containing protein [Bacteroidota bacterium]